MLQGVFFFFILCTVIEGIVAIFSRVKAVLLSVQICSLLPWNPVETNGLPSLLSTERDGRRPLVFSMHIYVFMLLLQKM